MCALAVKLESKIKSKGYVKLKKKKLWKWNNFFVEFRVMMLRLVWYTESISTFSVANKALLVPIFPKVSKHTYATSSLPMEKRSAKCFIHSHSYIYSFFNKKWHIEYVFLEIPETHSLGFQLVSHTPPIPEANPSKPKSQMALPSNASEYSSQARRRPVDQVCRIILRHQLALHVTS